MSRNIGKTKSAFIVWTPFHIYNAVRFIISNNYDGVFDLFFIGQSDAMYNSLKIMREHNIWDNIYVTDISEVRKQQKFWEYISLFISSKLYVRHLFGSKSVNNEYERIIFSVPTRLNDAIIRANQYSELVGYDDGIGSYFRDIYGMSLGNWFRQSNSYRQVDRSHKGKR